MSKSNKAKFVQATADNVGIGSVVRNDNGDVGKIVKLPNRGNPTVELLDGTKVKVAIAELETDVNAVVSASDVPAEEVAPKATPVRERKATIERTVGGKTYTYINLGGGHIDNGDSVAQRLRGLTLEQVYEETAKSLGCTVDELKARYEENNNPGRQRMTLGNMLRAQSNATAAGLAYVPPFKADEAKAARKAEREAKAAAAKADREAKAEAKKAAAAEAKAEAKKKADEAKAAKAEAKRLADEAKKNGDAAKPAKAKPAKAQAEATA